MTQSWHKTDHAEDKKFFSLVCRFDICSLEKYQNTENALYM